MAAPTLTLTLGEALRLLRERSDISQADLADQLEMGRTSVIRYEADVSIPKWKDVEAWAIACDHSAELVRPLWEDAQCRLRTGRCQAPLFYMERDERGIYRETNVRDLAA